MPKSEVAKAAHRAQTLNTARRFDDACTARNLRNKNICSVTDRSAATITGWRNGSFRPSWEDLQKLEPLLGHPPGYFFTGEVVGVSVGRVEQAGASAAAVRVENFKAALSDELNKNLRGLHYETWKLLVPDTSLDKVLPICSAALSEMEPVMRGSEMVCAMEMIHIIMDLAARGRYRPKPVDDANQILINAAKLGGNFCCFLELESDIQQNARPFLQELYSVLVQEPENAALLAATYCLHGDVLKIAAAIDPTRYPMSQWLLEASRDAADGLPLWSTGYPNTRSLAIVAGHNGLADVDYDKIAARVEGDIEGGHLAPFKSVHSRDGLVEMHAARFKETKDSRYSREAMRHWQLYQNEWKLAVSEGVDHVEFRFRGEILKTKLADAGIFEHLGCDESNAHYVLGATNTDLLREANPAASRRVAAQAERGLKKWRK